MNISTKNTFAIFTVLLIVTVMASGAQAGDKSFKEASKDAAKAVVTYPGNLVAETAEVIGNAAKSAAGVIVDTAKVTGETLTGDLEKTPEILTTPVMGSAKTIGEAAEGMVKAPFEAAESR